MFGIELTNQISLTAIYAAILSTILAILKLSEHIRKVKVKLRLSRIIHSEYSPENPFYFEFKLELHCVNKRKRQIQIDVGGLKVNNEKEKITLLDEIMTNPFPKSLTDGQAETILFDVEKLLLGLLEYEKICEKAITKIQAYVIDADDKEYVSKKIDFNVNDLSEFYPNLKKT